MDRKKIFAIMLVLIITIPLCAIIRASAQLESPHVPGVGKGSGDTSGDKFFDLTAQIMSGYTLSTNIILTTFKPKSKTSKFLQRK
jgi:hypothetical protein